MTQLATLDPNHSIKEEGLLRFCHVFHLDDLSPKLHPAHLAIVRNPGPTGPHSNMAEWHPIKQVRSNTRDSGVTGGKAEGKAKPGSLKSL